jgi:AcrR family transcriptional regulator
MLESAEQLDPRVQRTRQYIVEAFVALLQEKTMQSITVQDIAAKAGINRATFYAHFTDKYHLFDYLVRETFRQMVFEHIPENAPYHIENVKHLIVTTCEFMNRFGNNCHPVDKSQEPLIEIQVQSQIYDIMVNWLQSVEPNQATRELQARISSWAIFGAGLDWGRNPSQRSAQAIAEQVIQLLQEGVLA